jgi:hypothetical protein
LAPKKTPTVRTPAIPVKKLNPLQPQALAKSDEWLAGAV